MDRSFLREPLIINDIEWIPRNTEITNTHIIAGKGSSAHVRVADKLSEMYGGEPGGWMKKVGKVDSEKYSFDIHWYEHDINGQHDFKIKYYKERNDNK